jgi:Holliday junction resolvasome RuvABC endonuclease subunit
MRSQGFDPASSLAASALAVGGALTRVAVWKPPKKGSKNDHLLDWFVWCGTQMDIDKPDLIGVEEVKSARNMNTVRVLARWDAAVIIQARLRHIPIVRANVKEARLIAMGDGSMEKDEVFRQLRKRYPDLGWHASNAGGPDQSDAGVVALATPDLFERR